MLIVVNDDKLTCVACCYKLQGFFILTVTALHHSMNIEEDPDLIYGEEFYLPATAIYYPTLHTPTGMNVPAEFYEHPTISGFNEQGLNYTGHQVEGTSCMYYVVPDYGIADPPNCPHPLHPIAHPNHGPHPVDPIADRPHGPHHLYHCATANCQLSGGQGLCAETVEHKYYKQVRTSHCAILPSVADRITPIDAQPLPHNSSLFRPDGLDQTLAAAAERGVSWSPSHHSDSVSSMEFQSRTVQSEGQLHGIVPWKRQLADRYRLPDKPLRARQASRQSQELAVPSFRASRQANLSYSNHVCFGSDFYKMAAERFHSHLQNSNHANQRLCFQNQQNISKQHKPLSLMPSELIVKSYTSRIRIGDENGEIILRTDQYNRDDFDVVYPNAKFFVIKSLSEADVHKSIKYGVWSTSSIGNKKLDSAFREAQMIAASDSTSCPVFLFFSVNQSSCFCGVAEMVGPVDWKKDMDFWCIDRWTGSFPVKWHIIKYVHNSTFRGILLQNNGDKPVTSSRDTQEIPYTPGTTMLRIFKVAKADESLLHEFMMHEEEEASWSQHRRLQLRQAAPQFMRASMETSHSSNTVMPKSPQMMPASVHAHHTYRAMLPEPRQVMTASMHARGTYNSLLPPRSDSVLMDRITRDTDDLTDKLQGLNLDEQQCSWQELGNLTSLDSTAVHTQSYGIQAHENIVKAMEYQAYPPLTSNVKPASEGEHLCWKKVEITAIENPQQEAGLPFNAPEEYPNEGENALVHSASVEVPEVISEEQKIVGKPCSLATNSQSNPSCSKPRTVMVAIGSVLIPIPMTN